MKEIFQKRFDRLKNLVNGGSGLKDLVWEYELDMKDFHRLQQTAKEFIKDCIFEYHDQHEVAEDYFTTESFFMDNESIIKTLPNITPNGLVMPKKEILCSYNKILRAASKIVQSMGLHETCSRIHFPVNIRLRWSGTSEKTLNRPYSSTKWHSDIWAGESAGNVMVHIPIFGDFESNGVSIAETPEEFYPNYVKPLDDYDEGKEITRNLKPINFRMMTTHAYLLDSFTMHRTNHSNNGGIRGILSFPVVPRHRLPSDIYSNKVRDEDNYLSSKHWIKFGEELFLTSEEKLEPYIGGDITKTSYAGKFGVAECR